MLIYASFRLVKFANRTSELHASVKSKCGCLKIGYLYIHSLIIVPQLKDQSVFWGTVYTIVSDRPKGHMK